MKFPNEDDLRRERLRVLRTIEALTDAEFENGPTLCTGWAPRDVLAHLIGIDHLSAYFVPSGLTIDRGNAAMIRAGRGMSRDELTDRAHRVAERPARAARLSAWLLAADCAMHHQDILRGLGKPHDLPDESAALVFREGKAWRFLNLKPLRHRAIPSTPGVAPWGRGPEVHGTAEALGLWMAGRHDSTPELSFSPD